MDAKRDPLIEFKGASKTCGDRNILNRIDLSVNEGEVTTLIGLSGTFGLQRPGRTGPGQI